MPTPSPALSAAVSPIRPRRSRVPLPAIRPGGSIELDGPWSFLLDPENEGLEKKWFLQFPRAGEIGIGRPWEYWFPGYDGVAWYAKRIVLPPDWAGRRVFLQCDAVSYHAECWLNGAPLGSHEGAFTPFAFEIDPAACRTGENLLVVRVINPPANREIEGLRSGAPLNQSDLPIGKLAWYYNFGGIWQGARLACRSALHFDSLRVFPELKKDRLHLRLAIDNRESHASLRLRFSIGGSGLPGAGISFEHIVEASPGASVHEVIHPLGDLAPWSPDSPVLHTVRVEIAGGRHAGEAIEASFGVREFTYERHRFLLNGAPIVLKGFLQQGMYPRTLALPETRRQAMRELLLLKRKGFNFLRIHLKPAPSWYLDLADRIGILVMHEPPLGWIANSPRTRERCLREVRELVARDANHPSIIAWCLFNEAFHLLGFTPVEILDLSVELAHAARRLDPSRLIISASGGDARVVSSGPDTMLHDTSDLHQTTCAFKPWEEEISPLSDAHIYCPYPAGPATVEKYRQVHAGHHLMFISEFGAPETPPDFEAVLRRYTPAEAERGIEDWRLHHDFLRSLQAHYGRTGLAIPLSEFIAQINRARAEETRAITHAIRINPKVGGYCFCQLADASGELFGATDVWRRPKPLFHALSAAVANPAIGLALDRHGVGAGETPAFTCTLISDAPEPYAGRAAVEVRDQENRILWADAQPVASATGATSLFSGKIGAALEAGGYVLEARFTGLDGKQSRHQAPFHVLPPAAPYTGPIGVRDVKGHLEKFLRPASARLETYGNNFRHKNWPILLNLDPLPDNRSFYGELYGQLRKIVELGGCAVLFQPETHALYRWLFPTYIGPQAAMRTCGYAARHPLFEGLPAGGAVGAIYAEIYSEKLDSAADVLAAGGEILFGAFSMNMWTHPAEYYWGAGLYRVPIGRGNVIVCHPDLPGQAATSAVAAHLLTRLIHYAASLIEPGGEEHLLSRCIDPLPDRAAAV